MCDLLEAFAIGVAPIDIPHGVSLFLVDTPSLPRAMRIMQALIHALEQRGFVVGLFKQDHRYGVSVKLLGEQVVFHLVERTTQKPTGKEYPRYDLVPNGLLSFEIGDWYPRPALTDGKVKKLENRLNDFVIKLLEEAFEARQRREERERREAETRERQRLEAIEAERQRKEQEKIDQWDEWMKNWRRAREVRAFARAIRKHRSPVAEGSGIAEWLQWAENYALSIDPLRPLDDHGGGTPEGS